LEVIKGKNGMKVRKSGMAMEKVGKIGEKSEARKMYRFC
jgi:hypothetical protein